jgi:hypothetical protein
VVWFPAGARDLRVQTGPGAHPAPYSIGTGSKATEV